ncbi:thioester-containing protein 1 allele S3-like [Malaya genurostris]|uniref:thioester-containing protein 1 allele S3-like n=1 Tax=Malaya genurostris TaxID=325434 RepID=UPI0026F38C79|nr:thioester-containing protein 1 allele S3-like [Malaya genurostris]
MWKPPTPPTQSCRRSQRSSVVPVLRADVVKGASKLSTLTPGRTAVGFMEASDPLATVEPLQPALIRRPGPVCEIGDEVFQPATAGKYTKRLDNTGIDFFPASSPQSVLLYYQNVGGMNTCLTDYLLACSDECFDIIALTETWLSDSTLSTQAFGTNYEVFRGDRNPCNSSKSFGGGVLVAIHRRLKGRLIISASGSCVEQVWVQIKLSDCSLFLCVVYIPPNRTRDLSLIDSHIQSLEDVIAAHMHPADEILIVGDFNFPSLKWLTASDGFLFADPMHSSFHAGIINLLDRKSETVSHRRLRRREIIFTPLFESQEQAIEHEVQDQQQVSKTPSLLQAEEQQVKQEVLEQLSKQEQNTSQTTTVQPNDDDDDDDDDDYLSIIGPKIIRVNQSYAIVFSNSLPHAVRLEVLLEGSSGDRSVLKENFEIMMNSKTDNTTTLQVGDIPWGVYKLSMKSLESDFKFKDTVDLVYDPKPTYVLMQTDKPVYKPGDVLRFRVLVMDIDTKPVTSMETVRVKLNDAAGNSIRLWPYAKLQNGVFDSSVQLPAVPVLGNWTMTVVTTDDIVEKKIKVQEYVLPKVFIKVYAPMILLIPKRLIRVAVEAVDTFGMHVGGMTRVDLYLDKGNRRPDQSKTLNSSGLATVDFHLKEELKPDHIMNGFKDVLVKVHLIEMATNQSVDHEQIIPVFKFPYKISLMKVMPHFMPSVPFPVEISLKDHYGKAVKDADYAEVTVRYKGKTLLDESDFVERFDEKFDKYGIASLILRPPLYATRLEIKVKYDSVDYGIIGIGDSIDSKNKQSIRMSLRPGSRIRPNNEVTFDVNCSENMDQFSYAVGSRKTMITSGTMQVQNKSSSEFRLDLTPRMIPKATVLVYYISHNSLIFDELDLDFEVFNNDFKLQLDQEEYRPSQNISVNVQAANDSYVALGAIDQNALLMGTEGNEFTRKGVLEMLEGMDFFISTSVDVKVNMADETPKGFLKLQTPVIDSTTYNRTRFHESCMWKNFTMPGDMMSLKSMDKLPDLITSWLVNGFALSPTMGLGFMSQPQSAKVRKPFYMMADLPYSIKRNMETPIHVTVYNFMNDTLVTDVTLTSKNNEFEIIEKGSINDMQKTKVVAVPMTSKKTVMFMVKPKVLGEITLKMEANNIITSDETEYPLRVVPESRMFEKTETRFIELPRHGTLDYEIDIDIPRNIDDGSANIKFMLHGDVLGQSLPNMDALIRAPSGPGEQNILIFAYNTAVLDYHSETGALEEDVVKKAVSYLKSGYQKQLNFKHTDGSFSNAGSSDLIGSTLLTAFVAKWFMKADKYIVVDKGILAAAFRWLASAQKSNGRSIEFGEITNPEMHGDILSTKLALTAFVLITFLENEAAIAEHKTTVQKMMHYLAKKLDSISDIYEIALVTYALTLGNHPTNNAFFDKLYHSSVFDKQNKSHYWDRPPVSIETTGYALLSFIEHGKLLQASSIMRWLKQQNYTAATPQAFVGIEALTKLANQRSPYRNDYRLSLRHHKRMITTMEMDRNKPHKVELNLPPNIRSLEVHVDGIGSSVFQVIYQYSMDIEKTRSSFHLDVTVLNSSTYYEQHLKVCVRNGASGGKKISDTAQVEVFFPSGFIVDEEAVQDLSPNGDILKAEVRFGASSVVVYYDSLGYGNSCFKVIAYRRFKPAMHRPAYVAVSDYYDTDRVTVKSYEGIVQQMCDICQEKDCLTMSC